MEKKQPTPSRPNAKSPPTLLGEIFNELGILVLLGLLAWLFLFLWFGIKSAIQDNYHYDFFIQEILKNQCDSLNFYHPKINEMLSSSIEHIECQVNLFFLSLVKINIVRKMVICLIGSLKIIVMRICVFLISLPLLLVILGLFIIDGLVQRDIRKFKGEKESALFFHRSKLFSRILFNFIYFIFLAIPFSITPQFILIPMDLLCGLIAMLSIKNFKKYV